MLLLLFYFFSDGTCCAFDVFPPEFRVIMVDRADYNTYRSCIGERWPVEKAGIDTPKSMRRKGESTGRDQCVSYTTRPRHAKFATE